VVNVINIRRTLNFLLLANITLMDTFLSDRQISETMKLVPVKKLWDITVNKLYIRARMQNALPKYDIWFHKQRWWWSVYFVPSFWLLTAWGWLNERDMKVSEKHLNYFVENEMISVIKTEHFKNINCYFKANRTFSIQCLPTEIWNAKHLIQSENIQCYVLLLL
jgi:hypothetical protein